ncbi:MAG: hypothetical protein ACYSTX_03610 [Planctomycetota bacterium]
MPKAQESVRMSTGGFKISNIEVKLVDKVHQRKVLTTLDCSSYC